MKIKILGNGGAINNGLSYNSFIINNEFLVEAPPDVMTSLFRENIDFLEITTIYISHFHADHYFGIPFLFLRLFNDESETVVKVIGPHGVGDRIKELCITAFGLNHPMQKWAKSHVIYEIIEADKDIIIEPHYLIKPIPLFHDLKTYGFTLEYDGKKILYLADTYWEDKLLEYIGEVNTAIVDLNGEKTDRNKVHISEFDLRTHALPKIKTDIQFYGTHLRECKMSDNEKIKYVKPGDEIVI